MQTVKSCAHVRGDRVGREWPGASRPCAGCPSYGRASPRITTDTCLRGRMSFSLEEITCEAAPHPWGLSEGRHDTAACHRGAIQDIGREPEGGGIQQAGGEGPRGVTREDTEL